jgi:MFS family permease
LKKKRGVLPVANARQLGFHYAWVVLAAAVILNIVARADQASFGVFIDPLVAEFGWKRGDISFAYSLAFLIGLPAVVIMGWLGDRYGARELMLVSAAMISVGTVLLGTIKELWQFYLVYAVLVGSTGHSAFSVLLPVIMTRWFYRRLGVAMGIYFAAQGIGPVLFAPLFRWLLENHGWQHSFTLIGIALGLILGFFALFIHNSPAVKGLRPYGLEGTEEETQPTTASTAVRPRLRDYLAQSTLWKLIGIHHIGCLSHSIILVHVVSMATFKGIPGVEAAGVLATIAGASVFSRFGFSILADRFGGRATLTASLLGQSLPVIILFFAQDAWVFYLFAVCFGLCYGGEMVSFPIVNKQLFGTRAPLGSIFSFEMVGAGIGMALGGWLGGSLFDMTGDYTWALLVSLVAGCLGLPLALTLPRKGNPPGSLGARSDPPTSPVGLPAAPQQLRV